MRFLGTGDSASESTSATAAAAPAVNGGCYCCDRAIEHPARRFDYILNNLGEELKHDRDLVLLLMRRGERPSLFSVADEFLDDREVALLAINKNGPGQLEWVGECLENDPEILAAAACSSAREAVAAAISAASAARKTKLRTGKLPPDQPRTIQ
jgi:hypothetical protein